MPSHATQARRRLVVSLTAAVSALALHAAPALAAAPVPALQIAPKGATVPAPAVGETVLKRLPAGAEELTFRGESASRTFTVQFGRTEAARTSVFQMALLNAVSLLPERSIVKVTVNGTVLAAVQAGSTDKPTLTPIRIPAGLLVPGANTIKISAALSHRVDCSVQATYELWAMLDPAQTGFVMPREAAAPIRSLNDLAFEPLAADGTTRIHLRMEDDPDVGDLTQAAGLVDTLVRRAGLVRPVVDVGPDAATGTGFDLVMPRDAANAIGHLSIVARTNGLAIGRDSSTNRLVVVIADATAASLTGAETGAAAAGIMPQQGSRKTLAELGMPTELFTGRHYTSALDVNLPPDFLASNDRARLLLDGSHASSLVEGSGLVFRVNGTLVSSMPLASGKSERFNHAIVELPLRFFHPGHNDLAIEGSTSAAADAQCDMISMPREPRLTIAGTSELDFPAFAHLVTQPQLSAALAYDAAMPDGVTHLYLPGTDRASIGAGLTVLANMAVTQGSIGAPQLHLGLPVYSNPPGIVVAGRDDLPESLNTALAKITSVAAKEPAASAEPAVEGATAVPVGDTTEAGLDPEVSAQLDTVEGKIAFVVAIAQKRLRDHGFFFTGDAKSESLPVAADGLMIAAVAQQTPPTMIDGFALPRVTRDPAHWLVVTSADRNATAAGLAKFVASGRWSALAGEAVSFDPGTDSLHVLQPRTVSYVLPDRLVLSDLRPILGGIMSNNILLSVGVLFVLMTVLGLSTHVIVRRAGVR